MLKNERLRVDQLILPEDIDLSFRPEAIIGQAIISTVYMRGEHGEEFIVADQEADHEKEKNRVPHAAHVACIQSLTIHNTSGGNKDYWLRSIIQQSNSNERRVLPPMANPEDLLEESRYNKLPFLGGSPVAISAIKTQTGQEVSFDTVNSGGFLRLHRAHDVVAAIGGEKSMKPDPNATIEQIVTSIESKFSQYATVDENGVATVEMSSEVAEALRDEQTNMGVIVKEKHIGRIRQPDRAFLHCLYFGTQNVPDQYQEMARQFNRIADEGTSYCPAHTEAHAQRLRGWTKERGVMNPHSVNAGWFSDHLFVEELLMQDMDGIPQGSEQFHDQFSRYVESVTGAPVNFTDADLLLIRDIMDRTEGRIPEQNEEEQVLRTRIDSLNDHLQHNDVPIKLSNDITWRVYERGSYTIPYNRVNEYIHWIVFGNMVRYQTMLQ